MLLDVLRMDELASIKTMFVDFFSDIRSGLIGQVEAKIEEFNVLVLPEVEKRIMANKATEEMIVELKKKMMQLENEVIVARSELAELRSQLERNHTRQLAAGCGKCHCVDEPNEDSQLTVSHTFPFTHKLMIFYFSRPQSNLVRAVFFLRNLKLNQAKIMLSQVWPHRPIPH